MPFVHVYYSIINRNIKYIIFNLEIYLNYGTKINDRLLKIDDCEWDGGLIASPLVRFPGGVSSLCRFRGSLLS